MKITLCLSLFLLPICSALSQDRVPAFSIKSDSVLYAHTHAEIMRLFSKRDDTSKVKYARMDSLMNITRTVRDRSQIGWLYVYKPSAEYISFDSLLNGETDALEITRLSISNFKGSKLPRQLFACTNLEQLQLVNTHINKLQKKLNNLSQLKRVDIYNNIPKRKLVLGKNSTIMQFRMRGNNPGKFPKDFKNLKAVDTLDLAKNLLTKFPNVAHNHMAKLILTENALTLENLPNKPHPSLQYLLLGENKITKVPDAIGNFTSLKKLNFQSNKISEVSLNLGNLTSLEEISFYKNELKAIPQGLFKLHNLRLVDLYYNQIDSIEDDIAELKNLYVLYLSHNKLTHVPSSIGELTNLRELYLHHNLISSLPESLVEMKELQVLRINNNLFTTLPDVVFHLKRLNNLDISENNIITLPSHLADMNLHILAMTGNPWIDPNLPYAIAQKLRATGAIVHLGITKEGD